MSAIAFARDGFAELASRLRELGVKRALVITGASRRFAEPAVAALVAAGIAADVFDGARVHVPAEVVATATARLADTGADAIVAIGGGSAIGLGKALRVARDGVRFAVMPTTYAGSERTTMYGVTRDRDKQTGRDPRVAPDVIVYDLELARAMPIALTAQSLLNAFAHVASVIATDSVPDASRGDALAAAHGVLRALEDLQLAPRALVAREHAARAASACAAAFELGVPGAQHGLAHLLGGALGVDHAALHAILLPQFLAWLRGARPDALDALERAVDRRDLESYVHDLLVRAGAPVSLAGLGTQAAPITLDAVRAALATKPELPAGIALDAMYGLRPPGRHPRIELGGAEAIVLGAPLDRPPRRAVLVLHGRGAEPGTIARRYREIAAHDPDVAVIGLRAHDHLDRWYAVRYGEPGAGTDAEVERALARVGRALDALAAHVPRASTVLAGFSQGACLALEYAARHGAGLAAVIAPCGARIGQPADWTPAAPALLAALPVMIGAAHGDKWIARADLDATAAWFRAAGAAVDVVDAPGDRHEITLAQRLRARELVLGHAHSRGAGRLGSHVEAEAIAGALPPRANTPRVAPFGLYPEQINATGFTAPRADNARSWCYRVRPSSQRRDLAPLAHPRLAGAFPAPAPARLHAFAPLALPAAADDRDFVDGLVTLLGAGDASLRRGYALHRYAANRSMNHRAFYSADGDLLILPERGELTIVSELGPLRCAPGALALIPRGVAFSVLVTGDARGYVAEPFGRHFRLPERGPIGANGVADARHFRAPAPWFEDRLAPGFEVIAKLGGALWRGTQDHSPFDVVAWHGNLAPTVYDLADFTPVGNTAFDHGDPSIYTVLSAPLDEAGSNTLDLVVFPTRWDATTGTFRPPYFHRNAVVEINGIVREPGHGAFEPGCVFVTPPLTPHGVGGRAVERQRALADAAADAPHHHAHALWFQLESALAPSPTPWAEPVEDWPATWGSHRSYFER